MRGILYKGLMASLLLAGAAAGADIIGGTGNIYGQIVDFQANQPMILSQLPGGQKYHMVEIYGNNSGGCYRIITQCGTDCSGDIKLWIRRSGGTTWIPLADDDGPAGYPYYANAFMWLDPQASVEVALAPYYTSGNNMNFWYSTSIGESTTKQSCISYTPAAYVPTAVNAAITVYGYK